MGTEGVEYERWLIAKGSVFLPSAAALVKLVERLRKDGWIGKTGGVAVKTVEASSGDDPRARSAAATEPLPAVLTAAWLDDPDREELRLVWPVEGATASALRYPLSLRPAGPVTYTLELHRASDYVYPTSETIEPVPTLCVCGEELAFQWDTDEVVPAFEASSGIFAECEACSRTFDPAKGSAMVQNPFDESRESVRGGAAYRFALKVDCGKCFVEDPALAFAPELVSLLEEEFGRDFLQIGAAY
jgi:hypothetical protein